MRVVIISQKILLLLFFFLSFVSLVFSQIVKIDSIDNLNDELKNPRGITSVNS